MNHRPPQQFPEEKIVSNVVVITGSPSRTSSTERVGAHVGARLADGGIDVEHLRLRCLPAGPLLAADTTDPAIAAAGGRVAAADGIVLATPTYKAAYSGLLKTFLDLLPQFGFANKAVLPLATGGSPAHVLALDYGLRPVVHSLGARHVVQSLYLLSSNLRVEGDRLDLDPATAAQLADVLAQFGKALGGAPHTTVLGRSA